MSAEEGETRLKKSQLRAIVGCIALVAATLGTSAGAHAAPQGCVIDTPASMKKQAKAYYSNINKGRWVALGKQLANDHSQSLLAGIPAASNEDSVDAWKTLAAVFPDLNVKAKTLTADTKTTSTIKSHRKPSVSTYGDITLTGKDGKAEVIEFGNTLFFDSCDQIVSEEWVIATPPAVVSAVVEYLTSQAS